MFCEKCGSTIKANDIRCINCGFKVKNAYYNSDKDCIGYGNSIEEAVQDAKNKLGISSNDDIKIEILKLPKKSILGLNSIKATVKVTMKE